MKGTTATTVIGPIQILSVLGEDGNLYVPSTTLSVVFSVPQKHISRELKTILGDDSLAPQINLVDEKDTNLPKRLTCIPVSHFERVLRYYDKKGNPRAEALSDLLVGLSITQLFYDAHGKRFEVAEREAWVKARMQSKETRRLFTDAAQDWFIRNHGVKPEGRYYAALTNRLYGKLFGKTADTLKSELGVPSGAALRDYLPKRQLGDVEAAERILVRWVDSGTPPDEALAKI